MFKLRLNGPAALLAAVLVAGCGGGGGDGGDTGAVPSSGNQQQAGPAVTTYSQTVVLGRLVPEPASFVEAQGATGTASIIVPTSSTLLHAGSNPLLSVYRRSTTAGVIVACVSSPGSGSTGVVEGINIGINSKSVAALIDDSWTKVTDLPTAWGSLAAGQRSFEGWENCGEKPEGRPSPSSTRTLSTDGGFTEEVYDGNPSTNFNIIALHYSAAQAAAMLSAEGYPTVTQSGRSIRITMQIYRNSLGEIVLVEQGLPEGQRTDAWPGYLSVYFQR